MSSANFAPSLSARPRVFKAACCLIILLLLCPRPAAGHNPMSSWAVARLHADRLELEVEMASESAWLLLGEPADSPPDVANALPRLRALGPSLYRVFSADGREFTPRSSEVELREEDGVAFLLTYPKPSGDPLRFDADYLQKLSDDHRTTITLKDEADAVLRTELLNKADAAKAISPTREARAGDPARARVSFWAFLKLGVEHILTGYDHLLFLLGLLVACRRFSTMALVITCFTLAHSVTLALAALDVVSLSPRVVEPLIAASIVFVGVENLLRRDEPRWRWALTFVLGLVHGFGFAGVLREAGLGSSGAPLLVPLFSFNLGVELGQIAVAAVLLPLLWKLRDRPAFERYGRNALSAAVALLGAFWLVQRVFFS